MIHAARNVLALYLFFFVSSALSQELTRAARPDIKEGDSWVYQVTDVVTGEKRPETINVVQTVTGDRIVIQSNNSIVTTWTRDWNLVESKQGEVVTFKADPGWDAVRVST